MRITTFDATDTGEIVVTTDPEPELGPFEEFDGAPLERVRLHEIETRGEIELQLVEIAEGGRFAMHSSPKLAFCQVVRGRGLLGLPGGRELSYDGPETFVFHPDTRHDWHDVEADTLLAVAIVPDAPVANRPDAPVANRPDAPVANRPDAPVANRPDAPESSR